MRLTVKADGGKVLGNYHFAKGPIQIGRHNESDIVLSDKAVSRNHAVVFDSEDGVWMVEDLGSANKTFLNDKQIKKEKISDGNVIRIADFNILVCINDKEEDEADISLDDTLTAKASVEIIEEDFTDHARELQTLVRRTEFEHAPDIRMPAKRCHDYMRATELICETNNHDEMIAAILDIAIVQFKGFHCWCALRDTSSGMMTAHSGKSRDGTLFQFGHINFTEKITHAIEQKEFLLIPRVPVEYRDKFHIHSCLIAPVLGKDGCYGVLYVDNDLSHEEYSLSDLDYLMLISIHTAAILKNF